MNREYHKWLSPHLDREMELLVFGTGGARAIVFPPRLGRFFDYENHGMVEALRPQIESGRLQLFCVDSVDAESLYCDWRPPKARLVRHLSFESYILEEVLPFSESLNAAPCVIAHGCSLGAFHAVNITLRYPQLFGRLIAFSGRYDLTQTLPDFSDLFHGHYDDDIYFNTPTHFLPNLDDAAILDRIRKIEIVLTVGGEDPFYDNNMAFSRVLREKGIRHDFIVWSGRAHRFRYWREMAKIYFE